MFLAQAALSSNIRVEIIPQFNAQTLVLNQLMLTNAFGQKLSVTRLDFLLSDIALHRKGGDWFQHTNWQAFVSVGENRMAFEVNSLPDGEYDRVRFSVGLSPDINHARTTQYPPQHPLNPNLNGLHWSWAGGYVFFAIEGHWMDRDDRSGYSFHLGNDWMLASVDLPVSFSSRHTTLLPIALNVDKLFDFEVGAHTSSTHSRTNDSLALRLRKNLQLSFAAALHDSIRAEFVKKTSGLPINLPSGAHPYRFTMSSQFPLPELPRDNPLTEEGVELGHRLFGEKLLSVNNQQSCASCHREENAFSDTNKQFSHGAAGELGKRNSMPIFNLAWKKSFFWDGRAKSVREQVLEPIQNPIEMHETLERVIEKLSKTEFYPGEFQKAFGSPEITTERVAKALEQFVLSRVSYNSKFDRAFDGKEELSEQEKRGFELFMTEYDPRRGQYGADCFHCHGGPLFQSQTFANNGLDAVFKDLGRYEATRVEGDNGKFAVPSLRNVEITAPYMHDGRFDTLEAVIEHYATGVKRSTTLDPNIAKHPDGGVPLSEADKKALVAFLKTLTDETYFARAASARQIP